MAYNFALFFRSFYKSFFRSRGTHAHLTRKRFLFLLLFYVVWPLWGLVVWFSFLLDEVFFPAYKRQPLEKPLFIMGNFRSGSTFLQRLLAKDVSQFTSATIWDIFISPSVTLTKFFSAIRWLDARVGSPLTRLLRYLDRKSLGRVEIHRISLFKPEEDENFLLHLWSTSFASMLFPFMDEYEKYFYFDQRLPEKEKRGIMRFYLHALQRHLYTHPQVPHHLSKNPSFSPKVGTILEEIPDARIIYLVREPVDMLLSTISWLGFTWRVFSDPLVKYPFIDEIIEFSKHWYEYPLRVLSQADPDKYMIIKYDELVADPEQTARKIYRKFGYKLSPDFERALITESEKSKRYSSNHTYSLEEMGITKEQVLKEYREIYRNFGFKRPQ
jgi:DNA-binding transcriptional ArsR family regulator